MITEATRISLSLFGGISSKEDFITALRNGVVIFREIINPSKRTTGGAGKELKIEYSVYVSEHLFRFVMIGNELIEETVCEVTKANIARMTLVTTELKKGKQVPLTDFGV
jgi:hypothetical protein